MKTREWARATYEALKGRPGELRQHYYTMEQVEEVLEMGIDTLIKRLISGEDFSTLSLGRLWVEQRSARTVVSNLNGTSRTYEIEPSRTVRFRPSSRLLHRLKSYLQETQP